MLKTCREMMTRNPVYCLPSDMPEKAAQLMEEEDVGSIPVVEDEGTRRLVGIVTDRDLALRVVGRGASPKSLSLESIMTRNPLACREDDEVRAAMELMAAYQVRHIPVIDGAGSLVGMISQGDVALRMKEPVRTWELVKEVSKS